MRWTFNTFTRLQVRIRRHQAHRHIWPPACFSSMAGVWCPVSCSSSSPHVGDRCVVLVSAPSRTSFPHHRCHQVGCRPWTFRLILDSWGGLRAPTCRHLCWSASSGPGTRACLRSRRELRWSSRLRTPLGRCLRRKAPHRWHLPRFHHSLPRSVSCGTSSSTSCQPVFLSSWLWRTLAFRAFRRALMEF